MQKDKTNSIERSPVVVIMGHIDHGKSTLLSYIRNWEQLNLLSNVEDRALPDLQEAGGITQHISAYEVLHTASDGKKHNITFLDTPGHEAFVGIRRRGASVADIAVLVVSAEDGVKPQTLEALKSIKETETPYIVAINKIDKSGADVNKTKQNLAENEVYLEGYGGDVPVVSVSAKTGEGVPELLDMITLVAELQNLTGNRDSLAQGIVIESHRDVKKGVSATCIIKNGSMEKGMFIGSGVVQSPVRIMQNYLGQKIERASFSSPIEIIGWDELPKVGNSFEVFKTQKEVRNFIEINKEKNQNKKTENTTELDSTNNIPIIIKADTGSSLEAVLAQVNKLGTERTRAKIISSGIGTISENDIRTADGNEKAVIVGFNTGIDSPAKNLAERNGLEIKTFDIIYKLTEWLTLELEKRTPKIQTEEHLGIAKVIKIFSKVKDKQILGGRVEKGSLTLGAQVKIMRRDVEICTGKIRELQKQKVKVSEVSEGADFGALIEAKMEIAPGDYINNFIMVEK